MARERSLKLTIRAQVDGARRALQDTARDAKKVGEASEEASKRSTTASERLVQSARNNRDAWDTAGTTIAGFGAVAAGGFAAATVANLGFEKSMSGVKAVANATESEMASLTQQAIDMGAATVFSASEAATAQGELARAGISTADILGGALEGALNLAAAGNLELADAAVISGAAMNLFNLEGKDANRIADVLASGANKSAADVADLGQALQQAGTVAAQTGLSLEETVAALSMFADQGIRGSDAGTSLKTMLQRLTPQSKEAQQTMEELGFSAFDAQGNFIGLQGLAGELESSFGGLDTQSRNAALGVAFGSDAIRGAAILMEGGTAAAREYEEAMNDQGAAARVAGTQMDNLAGDLEELKGSIETALIQSGSTVNGALRGLTQGATDLVNVYNDMPPAVQGGLTVLSGVAGVAGLAAGGIALGLPRYIEFQDSLAKLAETSPRAASGIGKVAGATAKFAGSAVVLVGVATALEAISNASEKAAPGVEEVTAALLNIESGGSQNSLDQLIDRMEIIGNGSVVRAAPIDSLADAIKRLDDPGPLQQLESLDKAFGLSTSADQAREAISAVDGALAQMSTSSEGAERAASLLDGALAGTGYSAEQIMEHLPAYRDALAGLENEQKLAADGAGDMGAGMSEAAAEVEAAAVAAEEAAEAHDALATSLSELGSVLLGARGSARDYQAAIDEAAAAAKEHGQNLDISTEAGRANQTALDGLAGSTVAYAEAAFQAGAGSQEVASIVRDGRAEFVSAAESMGLSATEAGRLADSLGLIPENVVMRFEESGIEGIVQDVNGVVDHAASVEALIQMGADPLTAEQVVDDFIFRTSEREAVPGIDADPTEANAEADAWRDYAQSQRPVPYIDANRQRANAEADAWERYAGGKNPFATLSARSGPATSVAEGWARYASGLFPFAKVGANDYNARATVNGLVSSINSRWATVNVTARYAGGLNMGGAARNMVSARALGGVERRPMMMGPGYGPTNVILAGEPETRGEAFISNHPRYRTENISYLREAASWFGLDVIKAYAAGGMPQRYSMPAPSYSAAPSVVSSSPATATLSAEDRALLTAVISRPVDVSVDGRNIARAAISGSDRLGARTDWSSGPQLGRRP